MPLQREGHVGRRHAAAVIDHLDSVQPAICQPHRYSFRARVYGIFDQFLEGAGGSFNHFARGDAVDEMFGQTAY
ncbi:hypothetical protein GCM10007897_19960 [Sphingobium jiangsuense]|nr:hypothetical protein GCM10007897_19960 [Sphingobium jiangsuense]